ncbi:MAG TPA: glycosyltransferase [Nitrospiraceae bacterium]|nr:glycosyltransferase [Nitrospiraceae bacterium]
MVSYKPRVLFVIPGLPIGWRMIFIRNDIAAIEKLGIVGRSFYLVSRTSLPVLVNEARRFRREIKEFKPDLVHVHYGTVSAFFCAATTRLPLIITYQGSDLNPCPGMSKVRWGFGRILSQFAALRASRIICVSRELRDRLWWKSHTAAVLPSGVDTAMFRPMPKSKARAQLGWASHEKIVVSSAGTDPPRKRLDLAQAAVRVAESTCGKVRFIVLDGRTEHKEIPLLFNAADCLLLTSESEGSPNVVKEAIACGLPVVSVDVGDVKERLSNVQPSHIVGRDPYELGGAIARVLCDPQRSNGHEVVGEICAETISKRMLTLYRQVLERNALV